MTNPMTSELRQVFLVGGKKDSPFCDVFRTRESAVTQVLKYLKDEHWLSKMNDKQRRIVEIIRDSDEPELAIDAYNNSVGPEDQWVICEQQIRD